jgi:hypothetical protein
MCRTPGWSRIGAVDRQTVVIRLELQRGRRLAYALMVNDVGAIEDIEGDVAEVFEDEAAIANAVYEAVR